MGETTDGEGRVEFLDALRGVAVLGILPVNAAFFAYPAAIGDDPRWPGGPLDGALAHAVALLFELKFITIFSLLFGVGLATIRARALERGEPPLPILARRLGFLVFAGLAHAALVWYGDILTYYAFIGLVLLWAAGWSPLALRVGAAVAIALSFLPYGFALDAVHLEHHATTDLVREAAYPALPDGEFGRWTRGDWASFLGRLGAFDPDFESAVYRDGTLAEVVVLRGFTWAATALFVLPLFGGRIAGLFLLGMAWARAGWFLAPASEEGRRRFRRLLLWGLSTGVPLSLAALGVRVLGEPTPGNWLRAGILQQLGSLGLAAAYVALVARFCVARPGTAAVRALAAVGRTAFTNYLAQSAAMTILFYGTTIFLGAGFGLFGDLGRAPLLGVAALLAAAQVAGSVLWLRRFRMGPVEWLWRSATHLRWARLRSAP